MTTNSLNPTPNPDSDSRPAPSVSNLEIPSSSHNPAASTCTSFTRVESMASATAPPPQVDPITPTPAPADPQPLSQPSPEVPQSPQVLLTFLLISGKRRTMTFEPQTTIGRVKELVWNAWPSEWQDERPPAPSYLRILYLGKMLQDEDTLTAANFPISTPAPTTISTSPSACPPSTNPKPTPTIVHLSIRPKAFSPDDTSPKKKKLRRGSGDEGDDGDEGVANTGCACGCVVC